MFIQIILYIHILAATAWIGGTIFLFVLGISIRDKEAQIQVYTRIGPIYGYSETLWLIILWMTGLTMFYHFNIYDVMLNAPDLQLAQAMTRKLYVVGLITIATIIHMYISMKTKDSLAQRTRFEKLLSRATSMLIFMLNLVIIWFAIALRTILT